MGCHSTGPPVTGVQGTTIRVVISELEAGYLIYADVHNADDVTGTSVCIQEKGAENIYRLQRAKQLESGDAAGCCNRTTRCGYV